MISKKLLFTCLLLSNCFIFYSYPTGKSDEGKELPDPEYLIEIISTSAIAPEPSELSDTNKERLLIYLCCTIFDLDQNYHTVPGNISRLKQYLTSKFYWLKPLAKKRIKLFGTYDAIALLLEDMHKETKVSNAADQAYEAFLDVSDLLCELHDDHEEYQDYVWLVGDLLLSYMRLCPIIDIQTLR